MNILVIDKFDDEIIFNGSAEDFLESNGYNSDIEIILNDLNYMPIGTKLEIYGNQSDVFVVTRLEDTDYSEYV